MNAGVEKIKYPIYPHASKQLSRQDILVDKNLLIKNLIRINYAMTQSKSIDPVIKNIDPVIKNIDPVC